MAKSGTGNQQVRFEDAIEELERIIEQIEAGEIGLEESLQRYEQGMKLVTRCQSILDRAQKRIAELTDDGEGRLRIASGDEPPADEGGGGPT